MTPLLLAAPRQDQDAVAAVRRAVADADRLRRRAGRGARRGVAAQQVPPHRPAGARHRSGSPSRWLRSALLHGKRELLAAGAVALDGPALFIEGTILALAIASVMLVAEPRVGSLVARAARRAGQRRRACPADQCRRLQTEAYPLMSFAVAGMMLFAASNTLLVMFVALEILSLPLYLLAGLARRRRLLSQEAALKYFLLGAFSSAFFIYGVALLYGYAGTVTLGGIANATSVTGRERHPALPRPRRCSASACSSRSARRRSTPGRRTSIRARRPRSPPSWRPAPRSPRSAR